MVLISIAMGSSPSAASLVQKIQIAEPTPAPICYDVIHNYRSPIILLGGPTIQIHSGRFATSLFQRKSERLSWAKRYKRASNSYMGRLCYFDYRSLE